MSVDADDLDAATTDSHASSRKSSKALPSTNGSSAGVQWQSLWGSDGSENGIETAAAGSFLLGELLFNAVLLSCCIPGRAASQSKVAAAALADMYIHTLTKIHMA